MNRENTLAYLSMTPEERKAYYKRKHRGTIRKKGPSLTPEQVKEKQRIASAKYNAKKKALRKQQSAQVNQ